MTVDVESPVGTEHEVRVGGRDVVVVDDSPFFLELLEATLRGAGHRVRTTTSPTRALELLEERLPDLLIVDLVMPELSGFDLLARVRERWSARDLPALAVTDVLAQDAERETLRALGCEACVNKLAPPDHVLFRVSGALFPRSHEGRRHRRLAVSLDVQVRIGRSTSFAYSYTLSAEGMFVRSTDPPPPGTRVELSFALATSARSLRVTGEVVRQSRRTTETSPAGFAVRFTQVSDEDRQALRLFLEEGQKSGL